MGRSTGTASAEREPLAAEHATAVAELYKALANPLRVQLLLQLAQPTTVTELVTRLGVSQPLVSQHLRVLRTSGLVSVSRHGREAHYEIADHHIAHVLDDAVTHAREDGAAPTH